jgi:hypothetical protein
LSETPLLTDGANRSEVLLHRLFTLNALQPLFENVRSGHFEGQILQRYNAAKRYYDGKYQRVTLSDFERTPAIKKLALTYLQAALEAGEEAANFTAEERREIASLKVEVTKATALGDVALAPAMLALEKTKLLHKLSGSLRTRGLAETALSLIVFLKG